MLTFMKNWFDGFFQEQVRRKQAMDATQARLARSCVSNSHTCFVLDGGTALRSSIPELAGNIGATVLELRSCDECLKALKHCVPGLIFLDVELHDSDAVDVIRGLSSHEYPGAVQLFSMSDGELASDIHAIGQRYRLNMLPMLPRACSNQDLERILRAHLLGTQTTAARLDPAPYDVDLSIALDRGWIEPWYQPKIDLRQRALVGVEALARLNHPDRGIIPPNVFLSRASLGAMHKLTEYMLVRSMADWDKIRRAGFIATVAINAGVDSILSLPFAKLVRETRPSSSQWPGVIIEVTEEQAIRDISVFHEVATQMRIYGVSFSIDDFGAGYSSLARLSQVPFREIKLDGSFVKGCSQNVKNAAICKAVIDLAHAYEATATAEGVDNKDDLVALHQMGCDIAQGYLLCKPMPIDKLVSVLEMKKLRPRADHALQPNAIHPPSRGASVALAQTA